MDKFEKVLSDMAHLDRMRAAAENLAAKGNVAGPLALKYCDVGDEVSRNYIKLYTYLRENPDQFGSSQIRRQYEDEIKPLEEKRDSLARLFEEKCGSALGKGCLSSIGE